MYFNTQMSSSKISHTIVLSNFSKNQINLTTLHCLIFIPYMNNEQ